MTQSANQGAREVYGAVHAQWGGGTILDESGTAQTVQRAFLDASASGDTQIVAAQGAGIRIRVIAYTFVAAAAVTVKFRSASTAISSGKPVAANGGVVAAEAPHGWFQTAANEALNLNLSGAVAVGVDVLWIAAAG